MAIKITPATLMLTAIQIPMTMRRRPDTAQYDPDNPPPTASILPVRRHSATLAHASVRIA
jgi:hypothetical protein